MNFVLHIWVSSVGLDPLSNHKLVLNQKGALTFSGTVYHLQVPPTELVVLVAEGETTDDISLAAMLLILSRHS